MKTVGLIYRLYHIVSRNKSNVWATWFLPDCNLLGVTCSRRDRRNYSSKEMVQTSIPSPASIIPALRFEIILQTGICSQFKVFQILPCIFFLLKVVPWQQCKCSKCAVVTEVHKTLRAPHRTQTIFVCLQVPAPHIGFQWLIKRLGIFIQAITVL